MEKLFYICVCIIGCLCIFMLGFMFGAKDKLTEIKTRFLQTESKNFYSEQEVEIVIFGEIQL